ncbi:hypothetical protein MTBBW1_220031 [Desulfamplus magnetovallimortis]|uniref:Uncharacterized protein n=1 Tax=Desulfamplus magnetovallimortis TaxID=1246637 RepID=A0A1W1HCZ2_9BACT|nr:hypothetical protein MTBBW1_220031 [Desulfamplus magnetovallimortis]
MTECFFKLKLSGDFLENSKGQGVTRKSNLERTLRKSRNMALTEGVFCISIIFTGS